MEYHVTGQGRDPSGTGNGASQRERGGWGGGWGDMSQLDSGGIPRHGARGRDPTETENGASERGGGGDRSQLHRGGIPCRGTVDVIQVGQGTGAPMGQWAKNTVCHGTSPEGQREAPSGIYRGDGEQREEAVVYR